MASIAKAAEKQVIRDMHELMQKYAPEGITQLYIKTARHIEDTEQCMVTLPCRNKDKRLLLLVAEV